ncbi:Gamma-aminobutyric acid type B receptor subunit 1 [Holothuria leucospilota]|uniref:Gamma-aminobutyric acid type B receptor subunit 1 n=1 Tax=Holothuria leucospilota TaxID=206669 RepID=A0A9Q1CFE0_HOLLE|nr:Gamma-aminobutyric acid type B receptor subunit 1 [Holothuria leucospilota]
MAVVNNSCLDTRKIPLYIGGMMPISVGWDGSGCLVAAEYALEQINNRLDILPDYELIMLWNDTQCAKDKPLRALYDQVVVSGQTKVAILGPSCSPGVDLLAATSKYWNLLTILFAAFSPALSDRSKHPTVYRTIPIATNVFNDPYIWLIRNYGWSRVAFISKSATSFVMIQDDFVEKASKFNVSVATELIHDSAKNQIELLKNLDIRIIFLYTFEHDARQIFCEAHKSALSGPDIVWVIPTWFRDKWWLINDEKFDCSVEELAEMVEPSLIIGVDVLATSTLNKTTVAGVVSIVRVYTV